MLEAGVSLLFNLTREIAMRYMLILVLLAGCAHERQERRMAQYHARCSAYGFTPGTGDFAVCMQNLDMQNRAEGEAAMRGGAAILGGQRY